MMKEHKNRFFHLDPDTLWRTRCASRGVSTENDSLILNKVTGKTPSLIDIAGTFGGLDYPTGFGVDSAGEIYVVDAKEHVVKKYNCLKKKFEILPCLGGKGSYSRQLNSPEGMVISDDNIMYIVDTGNHRVQAFALKGLVLRWVCGGPEASVQDGFFSEPVDICMDGHEHIYVVDSGNKRIQKFSKDGRFILKFGVPEADFKGFDNPRHIATDEENRVYVVDTGYREVFCFDSHGKYIKSVQDVNEVRNAFKRLAVIIETDGTVLTIGDGGAFFPYLGKNEYSQRPLELEDWRYESEGTLLVGPFDSQIERCQWHRILIDAELAENMHIDIRTYTSEEKLGDTASIAELDWSAFRYGVNDFLIQSPPGRFLYLEIRLKGNISETPRLKWLRVYFPRDTYLKYLPAIYSGDKESKDFLERFLSIFETAWSGIEGKIDNISRYFNAAAAPSGEYLSWLAAWIGLVLDENWSEDKRRELVRLAPELYKIRGTKDGLRRHVEIYTGMRPPIIEEFKLRKWAFLSDSVLGCDSMVWSNGVVGRLQLGENSNFPGVRLDSTNDPLLDPFHQYANRFSVLLPVSFCDGARKEMAVRSIIDAEKPAHTEYSIRKVHPRMRVGLQSTIGVDSYIGVYPIAVLSSEEMPMVSRLGIDCVLGESPEEKGAPVFRVGRKSRVGIDTLIS